MINSLKRFVYAVSTDSISLARVGGWGLSLRWLACVIARFPACVRAGNMQPADSAMGDGPFRVQRGRATARLTGTRVISGIREIWCRDVYLQDDYLKISPDATVVDLGASLGNFTMLALAHGDNVRVVSVEPSSERNELFYKQLEVNGWQDRCTLDRCFIGGRGREQEQLLANPYYQGAEFISQEEFLAKHHLELIDFLKCDIEGSEFTLLGDESPILAITQQISVEVHDEAGDRYAFIEMLKHNGFEIGPVTHNPHDCIVRARRIN